MKSINEWWAYGNFQKMLWKMSTPWAQKLMLFAVITQTLSKKITFETLLLQTLTTFFCTFYLFDSFVIHHYTSLVPNPCWHFKIFVTFLNILLSIDLIPSRNSVFKCKYPDKVTAYHMCVSTKSYTLHIYVHENREWIFRQNLIFAIDIPTPPLWYRYQYNVVEWRYMFVCMYIPRHVNYTNMIDLWMPNRFPSVHRFCCFFIVFHFRINRNTKWPLFHLSYCCCCCFFCLLIFLCVNSVCKLCVWLWFDISVEADNGFGHLGVFICWGI